jgi:ABC-type molybdate transport system ATPase subunit
VALGRALLRASTLLLLDEPLTGLNAELRDAVSALLLEVKTRWGTPIVYVTHVPDEARALADEVIELREGSVVRSGRSR